MATYQGLKAHTHKFLFGLGALYEVISKKTPPDNASWTGVDMWEYYIKLDKATRDALEKEADDLTQACIYTLGCNSCEMTDELAKRFGLGNDDYCQTLNDAQQIHQAVFPRKNQGKNKTNKNNKQDNDNDGDGLLITAHITSFDEMSPYEQVCALIDDGHGYYDNGFSKDIIG